MMQPIQNLYRWLLNLGVREGLDAREIHHIRVTNFLGIIGYVVPATYIALFFATPLLIGVQLSMIALNSVFVWCNSRGLYLLARCGLQGIWISIFMVYPLALVGPDSGVQIWNFAMPAMAFLIFPRRQFPATIAFTIYAFVSYVVGAYWSFPEDQLLTPLSDQLLSVLHFWSTFTTFFSIPAIVYVFYRELTLAEDELRRSQKETDDILANVHQGLFTLDERGVTGEAWSARTVDLLGASPARRSLPELIAGRRPELEAKLREYLHELFHNTFMSRKMLATLNPLRDVQLGPRILSFSFARIYPERGDRNDSTRGVKGTPEKVMAVIEDRTAEKALAEELERRREEQTAKMEKLYQILNLEPQVFTAFVAEARDSLADLRPRLMELDAATPQSSAALAEEAFRVVHTLKGNARALNLESIAKRAHALEDRLDRLRNAETQTGAVAGHDEADLRAELLDALDFFQAEVADGSALFEKILNLKDSLQSRSVSPLEELAAMLRRAVQREKSVRADFSFRSHLSPEEEADLSPELLRRLHAPLVQIVRNAAVHGLEDASTRRAAGKPAVGRIQTEARLDFDPERPGKRRLIFSCEDDGRGLDPERIRAKAVERGLLSAGSADALSRRETFRLIFRSGLSTADRVSESAGRGVGMDIVREELQKLGARIEIQSEPGRFTRFRLLIPEGAARSAS